MVVESLSCVRLFTTPWTVAHQAPPSMGFSRQEYWSGLPFAFNSLYFLERFYAHSKTEHHDKDFLYSRCPLNAVTPLYQHPIHYLCVWFTVTAGEHASHVVTVQSPPFALRFTPALERATGLDKCAVTSLQHHPEPFCGPKNLLFSANRFYFILFWLHRVTFGP